MAQQKAHKIGDKERTDDIKIDETVDFAGMFLSDVVLEGLHSAGFERPSPIQLSAIPLGRCGLDLIVQAKSGTGKTCVFVVIALEMLTTSASTTQVLVVAPTREIAVQITQVFHAIGSSVKRLRAQTFIGGTSLENDKAKLQCCHVAVGTPGRLKQLVELKALCLDNVRLFVLDEADQLLSGQFSVDIKKLYATLPHNKQVLTLSATYTDEVAAIAEKFMRSPTHVRLDKDAPALLGVQQFVRLLPYQHQAHHRHQMRVAELMTLLASISFNQCLVFSNSQFRAESVCNELRASGWPVLHLTGSQAQSDRLKALDALCTYKCRILVSTDLSARGLDSEHVNLVINLDMPWNHATYLHRVGRAGRYGSRGCAVSLACEGDDFVTMRAIVALTNMNVYLLSDKQIAGISCAKNADINSLEIVDPLEKDQLEGWILSHAVAASKKKNSCTKSKNSSSKENKPFFETKHTVSKNHKEQCTSDLLSHHKSQHSETDVDIGNQEKNRRFLVSLHKALFSNNSLTSASYKSLYSHCVQWLHKLSVDDCKCSSLEALSFETSSKEDTNIIKEQFANLQKKIQENAENTNTLWHDVNVNMIDALDLLLEGKESKQLLDKVNGIPLPDSTSVDKVKDVHCNNTVQSISKECNAPSVVVESLSKETLGVPHQLEIRENRDSDASSYRGSDNSFVVGHTKVVDNRKPYGACSDDWNTTESEAGCCEMRTFSSRVPTTKAKGGQDHLFGAWVPVTEEKPDSRNHLDFEDKNSGFNNAYSYYENVNSYWPEYGDNSAFVNTYPLYYNYTSAVGKYMMNIQKFVSMMEYVKTLGQMSAQMAQDYHLKSLGKSKKQ